MTTDRFAGIAVKRLAEVEVRSECSNQHEFNAGALRKALGVTEPLVKGKATFLAYTDDSAEPIIEECRFTLYDARANHPTRSEYRMYYSSGRLPLLAMPGDLIVLWRRAQKHLIGIVAAKGSRVEARLQLVLKLGNKALERFIRPSTSPSREVQADLFEIIVPTERRETNFRYAFKNHPLVKSAVAERRIPSGAVMAAAAQRMAGDSAGSVNDPDLFLYTAMAIETDLFNEMEQSLGTLQLQAIFAKKTPSLAQVLSLAMRMQQARKSRRGQSLEYHFGELLRDRKVPHTAQCRTEPGEVPDFVIPGQTEYHDPHFPEERLRMVACKSTVRDRWRQVLNEARRIREKYLLTVDPHIPFATVEAMRRAGLRIFIPRQVISEHYGAAFADKVFPVAHLLGSLEQALTP